MLIATQPSTLIAPYGGDKLVDLMVPPEAFDELKAYASCLPSIQISPRSVCDLELLATGAFSPLDHFMGQEDHRCVLDEMRLADGHLFPIPITLPVAAGPELHLDQDIALRDNEYQLLAIMTLEEIYKWDPTEVADKVFRTQDLHHPLVAELQSWGAFNISGRLQILHLPRHYDFQDLRLTPAQTRAKLAEIKGENVIAFQPHHQLQRVHEELTEYAIKDVDGILLLHPVVGMTRPGDVDHYTRVRIYKALAESYSELDQVLLSLLPLATRKAGPREALWQALIHRNYGANNLIVHCDHASPSNSPESMPFYAPYEAQEVVAKYSQELGVKMVPAYEQNGTASKVPAKMPTAFISSNQVYAEYPKNGRTLSDWYIRREVVEILAETYLPRHRQGVCRDGG